MRLGNLPKTLYNTVFVDAVLYKIHIIHACLFECVWCVYPSLLMGCKYGI